MKFPAVVILLAAHQDHTVIRTHPLGTHRGAGSSALLMDISITQGKFMVDIIVLHEVTDWNKKKYDDLMEDSCIFSALALEILQPCTKQSIWDNERECVVFR